MPVIIRIFGYKIYFWLNESKPLEPVHVHIAERPRENATKIWILSDGKTEIANINSKIPDHDLHRICKTIEEYHKEIEAEWKQAFGELTHHDKPAQNRRAEFRDADEQQEEYSR